MKVIEYIKEHGTVKLNEEFGIMVKKYEEGLYVLNYDQINSPKSNEIVKECRGLILDHDFNIVSRSLDRFFNLGEQPDTQNHLDWSKAVCHEKVDGSLIKIYNWKGTWYCSTRGTAFAESGCNFGDSFKSLVFKALDCDEEIEFQVLCDLWLDADWTYICELTCRENRIVKSYDGYKLHYLASRHNQTGEFGDDFEKQAALTLGAREINTYSFSSVEDCIETAKHLPDLEEGYVVYQDGKPVCKVKSPAYVAVHHIRSNVSSTRALIKIALLGEKDELCLYFPEYEKDLDVYLEAWSRLSHEIYNIHKELEKIENQKDFAVELLKKTKLLSGIAFSARKLSTTTDKILNDMEIERKINLLEEYMKIE